MGGRAEGQACADPWARTPIGTSGILVLFFFFLSPPHTFLPEGVVLGLWNFARSFMSQNNKIGGETRFSDHPSPLGGPFLVFFFSCAWEAHTHVWWGFHEHSTIATAWIKLENTHLPSPLRHVRRKNNTIVDGGPSGGSSVRRPVSGVLFSATYFSPRWGYRRVLKFCMGF
jgi:hypothetical protein